MTDTIKTEPEKKEYAARWYIFYWDGKAKHLPDFGLIKSGEDLAHGGYKTLVVVMEYLIKPGQQDDELVGDLMLQIRTIAKENEAEYLLGLVRPSDFELQSPQAGSLLQDTLLRALSAHGMELLTEADDKKHLWAKFPIK